MRPLTAIIAACCTIIAGCTFTYRSPVQNMPKATIIRSTVLPDLPSGSAIQMVDNDVFIISDDAAFIYQCHISGKLLDSIRLLHLPDTARRIPKPVKPDYEGAVHATVKGRPCLVAFGSGSLRPQRETGIIAALDDSGYQQVVPLGRLYEALRAQARIPEEDFNIEAAALQGNRLLLFNRGSNHIFSLDWQRTLAHLLDGASVPPVSSGVVSLPKTDTFTAGISGASFLDEDHVLFSASVEATSNWVSDGEVLGSYVGIIGWDAKGTPLLHMIAAVNNETGVKAKEKLEGVYPQDAMKDGRMHVLGIVDNDDGTSRLLQIRLTNVKLP